MNNKFIEKVVDRLYTIYPTRLLSIYAIKGQGELLGNTLYTDKKYTINSMNKTWWDSHPGTKIVELELVEKENE